jgi:hypothetical protein
VRNALVGEVHSSGKRAGSGKIGSRLPASSPEWVYTVSLPYLNILVSSFAKSICWCHHRHQVQVRTVWSLSTAKAALNTCWSDSLKLESIRCRRRKGTLEVQISADCPQT